MTFYDFPFILSFVKYNIFFTIIYWGKPFLLRAQEENVFRIAGVDATQFHCFIVYFYKLNVPKWISGCIRRKMKKNYFFLFKSIDLDPKIKISNISASRCPIFMILGSLNLSHVVLARSSDKIVIYIADQPFLLLRSYKGQLKVKQKCCILCI